MIATMILCAALCACVCLYVLAPVAKPRRFLTLAFFTGLAALALYLVLGSPELPARPTKPAPQRASDMRLEAELMAALAKDDNDADAMIRLAALRASQGRVSDETLSLLERADRIKPGDRRVRIIRAMLENNPD